MPAVSRCTSARRRSQALVLALALASTLAFAQPTTPLALRLADIREVNRFVPERALPMLRAVETASRAAPLGEKAEFLAQMCSAHLGLGQHSDAMATCEELIALGREHNDNVALAKGLLRKGYVVFAMNELALSHQLVWDGEQLANTTTDIELRVRAAISSGEAHAEDGNFPAALAKIQVAAVVGRQEGERGRAGGRRKNLPTPTANRCRS